LKDGIWAEKKKRGTLTVLQLVELIKKNKETNRLVLTEEIIGGKNWVLNDVDRGAPLFGSDQKKKTRF